MSSVPVKKTGRPSVARDVVVAKVSTVDPRRLEIKTPATVPIISAIIVDVPKSSRVLTSRPDWIISDVTSRLLRELNPNWNVSIFLT